MISRRLALVQLVLLTVATILFNLATGPLKSTLWFVGIVIAFMIAGIYKIAYPLKHTEQKFYLYRTIAELLRINYFLKRLHFNSLPLNQPFHDLSLLVLLRSVLWQDIQTTQVLDADMSDTNKADTMIQYWITDQLSYFNRSVVRENKCVQSTRLCIDACIVISLLCMLMSIPFSLKWLSSGQSITSWLMFSGGFFGLFAAILKSYATYRCFAEHRNRYIMMIQLYGSFKETVTHFKEKNSDIADLSPFFLSLGKKAMCEVVTWHKLHVSRPLHIQHYTQTRSILSMLQKWLSI